MKNKIPLLLVIVFILMMLQTIAQNPDLISKYLDSLKTEKTDTGLIHIYSMLCFHYSMVNTDTAIMYGQKGKHLAEEKDLKKPLADVTNSLGWAYLQRNENDSAENLFMQALAYWKSAEVKTGQKVVMANLATLFMNKTDYIKSLTYLREVLKLDDETKDIKSKAIDLYTTGRLYNMQKNYAEARKYFQQSYDIHKSLNEEVFMAEALMSIGNTYQYEGDYEQSLKYYNNVLLIFKKFKNIKRLGLTYENMASCYANMLKYDTALKYYSLAAEQYKTISSKPDLFYALIGKGEVYKLLKDYNNALQSLNEALQYATEMRDRNLQNTAMKELAGLYRERGDYKDAYQMLTRSNEIKDSLFTLEKQNELLKLQTEFETERKEKENLLLKAQNDTANANLERNRIFLFAALAGLLLLGGLLYMIYKNKEGKAKHISVLQNLNGQLNNQKEEISRINTLLQLKALRVQMNPHFIFNCMSSIQECILLGQVDDANKYLSKLSKLLRMVLVHAEEESISLDKELEILELYLELESARLKQSFHYSIQVDETIFPDEIFLPTLILQPFVENAIWHGLLHKQGNRMLTVKISGVNDWLHCVIEDNGVGRAKAAEMQQLKKHHQSKG